MMDAVRYVKSTIKAVLPAAKLGGFSDDRSFSSSLAEALVRGQIGAAGGETLGIACFVLAAPSRGVIRDLAVVAKQISDGALPVAVCKSTLSDAKQQALRESGLAFFDAAGNAWLEAPGLVVDRRGMKAPKSRSGEMGGHAAGVFSDKATLVTRTLLENPPLGIRELCAVSAGAGFDISPGFASKVVRGLEERRYARRSGGKVQLANREGLLADWADAYRGMRHPRPRGWYLHAASAEEARDAVGRIVGESGALAGLAAASLCDGFAMFDAVDVYARDLAAVEGALEAAGAVRVERGANVNVSVPRYRVSAFHGLREFGRIAATSDMQTYLDLQLQPRRGREAAEHIMETRLRRTLSNDAGAGGI